jgi:hypothetical protein
MDREGHNNGIKNEFEDKTWKELKKQQTINIYVYVNNRPEKHRFKNCRD